MREFNTAQASSVGSFETDNDGGVQWRYRQAKGFMERWTTDGTSLLWWNTYHSGQKMHYLVAEGIVEQMGATFI